MTKFSNQYLFKCLSKIGVKKNSTILIHTGLNYFGELPNIKNEDLPKFIFNSLSKYFSKKSTILFPAYFYEFARKGDVFDINKSPPSKSLGAMSQYIFKNKKFYRSKHPLTSLIGMGKKAKYICKKSNLSDYGYNSAWSKLVEENAQILFFGVPLSKANTFIHFIEFQIGVPHMYVKKFTNIVKEKNKIISKEIFGYVRYLNSNVNVNQLNLEKDLKKKKILKTIKFGNGNLSVINVKDLLEFGLKKLLANPYYFLESKPKFKKGLVPLI